MSSLEAQRERKFTLRALGFSAMAWISISGNTAQAFPSDRDVTADPAPPLALSFVTKRGFIMIPGALDGHRGLFMLDTGTPFRFFINRDFVPLSDGTIVTRGNAASGQPIDVQEHSGSHRVSIEGAKLFEEPSIRSGDLNFVGKAIGAAFLGFIGLEFLKNYEFEIDYQACRISLRPLQNAVAIHSDAAAPAAILHFALSQQALRLDAEVGGIRIPTDLDTGARGSIRLMTSTRRALIQGGRVSSSAARGNRTLSLKSVRIADGNFSLPNMTLEGSDRDQIVLGWQFLRHYRSVWNIPCQTVWLLPLKKARHTC